MVPNSGFKKKSKGITMVWTVETIKKCALKDKLCYELLQLQPLLQDWSVALYILWSLLALEGREFLCSKFAFVTLFSVICVL